MSEKRIFKNVNQVHKFLTVPDENGEGGDFDCSYGKVRDAINARKLVPRRDGGFSEKAVMQYATSHLQRKVVVDSPAGDLPVDGEDDAPAVKIHAEAQLKAIQAKRAQFGYDKERGKYVETSTVEAELGLRAKAFTLGLEKFATDNDVKVASVFGGSEAAARELCVRLGVDPEGHVPTVIDFALSRTDRFKLLWRKLVPEFLDSYATGIWFDENMQKVWEKYEEAQEEEDAA